MTWFGASTAPLLGESARWTMPIFLVTRMWVAADVRCLGLGRRLLERLSAEAASRGMLILRLETNRSLFEAKRLYQRAGFVEVEPFNNEPYAHHWFEKDLRTSYLG